MKFKQSMLSLAVAGLLTAGVGGLAVSPLVAQTLPAPVTLSSGNPLPFSEVNQVMTGQCVKDMCANLNVRTAEFADHPGFSKLLTRSLLSMAATYTDKPATFASVQELISYFVANATPQTSEYLQANVLRSESDLVVVELVHYIFSGGAHGETTSQYVNWLPQNNQVATLETMLQPGARPAFETVLREEYVAWLDTQGNAIDDPVTFQQTWPFKPTDNVALMPDGVKVTYERYAIAPGSFGQPSFVIPYSRLNHVLKPEYIQVGL
ncbi:RsiV family protein [Orrella marina]|nr:RsiV family protein [Orrella marina]